MATFLKQIFQCDTAALPTEFIVHKFWKLFRTEQRSLAKHINCLNKLRLPSSRERCYQPISAYCPNRFGDDFQRMSKCKEKLWNDALMAPTKSLDVKKFPFGDYARCIETQRLRAYECEHSLAEVCRTAQFRSLKVVRAEMRSIKFLMKANPNIKIIHLIRDPRAILALENTEESSRSFYAGSDKIKEIHLYCRRLLNDILLRQELEKLYPNQFKEVIFDQFRRDAIKQTRSIYEFLNLDFTKYLEVTLNLTLANTNAGALSRDWENKLKQTELSKVKSECSSVFKLVKF